MQAIADVRLDAGGLNTYTYAYVYIYPYTWQITYAYVYIYAYTWQIYGQTPGAQPPATGVPVVAQAAPPRPGSAMPQSPSLGAFPEQSLPGGYGGGGMQGMQGFGSPGLGPMESYQQIPRMDAMPPYAGSPGPQMPAGGLYGSQYGSAAMPGPMHVRVLARVRVRVCV